MTPIERAASLIGASRHVAVLTGAGGLGRERHPRREKPTGAYGNVKHRTWLKYVATALTVVLVVLLATGGIVPGTSVKKVQLDRSGLGGILGTGDGEKEYKSTSVPLTSRTAATWIALQETTANILPDKTPLGEIFKSIKDSTKSKSVKLNFIVDWIPLHMNDSNLESPTARPDIKLDNISLQSYLKHILKPFGLVHTVSENVILISSPYDDSPDPREVSASEARTWLLLNEVVSLSISDDMPISRAIGVIQEAALGKAKNPRGLVIHVDPKDLVVAKPEADANLLLKMELDDVPIGTTLGLILERFQMGFYVRPDGEIVISKRAVREDDMIFDTANLADVYQLDRYVLFQRELRAGKGPPDPR